MKPFFLASYRGSAPVSYSFIVRDGHIDLFRGSDNNVECEQSAGSTLSRWIPQQCMPLVPELWMDKSGGFAQFPSLKLHAAFLQTQVEDLVESADYTFPVDLVLRSAPRARL